MTKKLIGADFLLALLYCDSKSSIMGSVRLTKMMYLFDKEIRPIIEKKSGPINMPEFFAYNFGPFSKDLYEQIELFNGINFIKTEDVSTDEDMSEVDDWEESPYVDELTNTSDQLHVNKKYIKYSIAENGIRYYEEKIESELSDDIKLLLEQFKKKIVKIPIKNLLYYVYSKYPEMTVNSLIKKEILGTTND